MKKILFFAVAIAAMTSCSQNDVLTQTPEAKQVPISFSPQVGNSVSTRADISLGDTISLGVFAYKGADAYDHIKDMRLRYMAEDGDIPAGWYLNPKDHYYPADGAEVKFWAYGPKGNTHLSSIDCEPDNGPKFTLTLSASDMGPTAVDLFATQLNGKGSLGDAATPVAFTLKRLLSQIKFEAKTKTATDATNYDVKIYDIAVVGLNVGDYSNKAWTLPAAGKAASDTIAWKPVDLDDTQAVLTASATSVGELVSVFPKSNLTIRVKARIYKKNQSALVVEQVNELKLTPTSLEPGKRYTYTITVSPSVGKIIFDTPKITDWEDAAGTPVQVGK